ncbi:MAG: hypothetical protein FWC13_05260 [Oscillospiraceae bacterium]|nr:hypothetical protein [Oscillospiraceae bacterium]
MSNNLSFSYKRSVMAQKQSLPYNAKVIHAELRAREYETWAAQNEKNTHVSVGGLDSIVLLAFLRNIGINPPAISVSSLEDKSIQAVHTEMGVISIRPIKSKVSVIKEYGFPVVSKSKASKIEHLQKIDSPKQTYIHAIMTGKMGKQGGYKHSDKIKLPDKWLKLFGGNYAEKRPDLDCKTAPFKVSDKCCYWLKEKPCDDWAAQYNSVPYLGLMASEHGQRELGLIKNGCNYYGKAVTRSCPFAIFTRQDLLQLALDLSVKVPAIYGTIERKEDGQLYTTRAQRTGCSMCGFGIHVEKRPHRFDRLREDNLKEWEYWMREIGWGEVLDWIGIEWENEPHQIAGQQSLY